MSQPPSAELVFVIETPVTLGRIEFTSEDGMPFMLANAPAGTTIYRYWVRPGRYCFAGVASGDLNIGWSYNPRQPKCMQVDAGRKLYGGHFMFSESGMRFVLDSARMRQQLADPSIEQIEGRAGTRPPKNDD